MKCIICENPAEYYMRGVESNAYCKKCAEAHFKMLDYLDKMQ